jgi:arginase
MPSAVRKPHIDLIGFPMDLGAGRRGVDMGPSALRIAGIREKLESLGYRVSDQGDVAIRIQERQKIVNPSLRYLEEIVRTSGKLAKKVKRSLDLGHFPLCIGGDHSMALGSIAGIAAFCRETNRRPGVIWIDAHADMNTAATTPSGNIHGMPMAASLGLGDPALTHLLGFSPKVLPQDCALLGVRRIDAQEKETIRNLPLAVYTMTDIDRRGIDAIITEVIAGFRGRVDHIHVSFDLDGVDPLVAGGVGTREPGGLTFREAHLIMETIAECGCMASLEVAEVNPILDHKNRSAEFAAEIVASSLGLRIL